MAGIGQYLKDTRSELRHVAWPTQLQTIVYTILVALISVGVAAYLGLFDFLFTTGLTKIVSTAPAQTQTTQQATTTAPQVNFSVPNVQTTPVNSTPTTNQ